MKHGIIHNGIKGPFSLKKVNVWDVPSPAQTREIPAIYAYTESDQLVEALVEVGIQRIYAITGGRLSH
jgi:hypothetical protein